MLFLCPIGIFFKYYYADNKHILIIVEIFFMFFFIYNYVYMKISLYFCILNIETWHSWATAKD